MAAPPSEVNWSALSPGAREAIGLIAMRLAAGLSYDEIASELERTKPTLKHLGPPTTGTFTKAWVSARLRSAREEILAQQGPS